jgi:hypothetical protein
MDRRPHRLAGVAWLLCAAAAGVRLAEHQHLSQGYQQALQLVPGAEVPPLYLGKYSQATRPLRYSVTACFSRRNDSFTQGLVSVAPPPTAHEEPGGSSFITLIESTGLWGESKIHVYNCRVVPSSIPAKKTAGPQKAGTPQWPLPGRGALRNGGAEQRHAAEFPMGVCDRRPGCVVELPPQEFGEGLALFPTAQRGGTRQLWQLSYRSRQFFVYRLGVEAAAASAAPATNAVNENTVLARVAAASRSGDLQSQVAAQRRETCELAINQSAVRVPYPPDSFAEGWGLAARELRGPPPQKQQHGPASIEGAPDAAEITPVLRVLYVTNGSDTITVLRVGGGMGTGGDDEFPTDAGDVDVSVVQRIRVVDDAGSPVHGLNAISWDEQRQSMWACVYGAPCVVQIAMPYLSAGSVARARATTGAQHQRERPHRPGEGGGVELVTAVVVAEVINYINLADILPPQDSLGLNVLNGVAVVDSSGTLIVTGKWWNRVYQLRLSAEREKMTLPFDQQCRTTLDTLETLV